MLWDLVLQSSIKTSVDSCVFAGREPLVKTNFSGLILALR